MLANHNFLYLMIRKACKAVFKISISNFSLKVHFYLFKYREILEGLYFVSRHYFDVTAQYDSGELLTNILKYWSEMCKQEIVNPIACNFEHQIIEIHKCPK